MYLGQLDKAHLGTLFEQCPQWAFKI